MILTQMIEAKLTSQSGFLFWGTDRLISFARLVIVNKLWLIKSERREECGQATIEVLDGEVMRLTVKRELLEWKAGQHAYVPEPCRTDRVVLMVQIPLYALDRLDKGRTTSFQLCQLPRRRCTPRGCFPDQG